MGRGAYITGEEWGHLLSDVVFPVRWAYNFRAYKWEGL